MGQKIAVGALALVIVVGAAGGSEALDKMGTWVRNSAHYVSVTWDSIINNDNSN